MDSKLTKQAQKRSQELSRRGKWRHSTESGHAAAWKTDDGSYVDPDWYIVDESGPYGNWASPRDILESVAPFTSRGSD